MGSTGSRLAAALFFTLTSGACLCRLFAGEVRLEQRKLVRANSDFLVRGVGYAPFPVGWRQGDPVPDCVHARDLPLMATMGANTVRTYARLEENDTAFLPLLETTGLTHVGALAELLHPARAGRRNPV